MSRRRMIAILSAALLLGGVVVAVLLGVALTQTAYGLEQIRTLVTARIGASALGDWHIGRVSGNLITGFQIDSLEIRDADDSLFVASGPIKVDYDIRDLIDRRVLLRKLEMQRPVIRLTKHRPDEWNFDRLFAKSSPAGPVSLDRGFDDFISARTIVIHDGTVILSEPWRPDSALKGARRDSAIAHNLARSDARVVRTKSGFSRIRRWDGVELETAMRWSHPDSAGRFFDVRSLSALSFDPPLDVRNARGTVKVIRDSVWLDVRHFDLPGSTGSLTGTVVSGGGLPTRYALAIQGDSISLADVNWVHEPLPLEGSGRANIRIRNSPSNLRLMEYELTSMDLRTMQSRIRGRMTFGVGEPILRITHVDLEAAPLDFRLIEHLGGSPFPVPWRGQFTGRVQGTGGPLDRFAVEDAEFTFADANVPLAFSRGTARGEVDITHPADAIFRGFDVEFSQLDLRTPEFLFASFPRHGGTASGSARLDSIWRDVRFSNSDFFLHRGEGPPSHFTGSGRITAADPLMIFDLDLIAAPLSFTALAQAYPGFPLRGLMNGPVMARGTMEKLNLSVDLTGQAGKFAFNGVIDDVAPGYSAEGTVTTTALDMRALLGREDMPALRLTSVLDGKIVGDSLGDLRGDVVVRAEKSSLQDVRIASTDIRLRFANGSVQIDSGTMRTSLGSISVSGGLGLTRRSADSARFRLVLDSLAGLPDFLASFASVRGNAVAMRDSLSGSLTFDGYAVGPLNRIGVRGTIVGGELALGAHRVVHSRGGFSFANLFGRDRDGEIRLEVDSAYVAGMLLETAVADLVVEDAQTVRFRMAGTTAAGATGLLKGVSRRASDVTHVSLDSLRIDLTSNVWELGSAGTISDSAGDLSVQRLVLNGREGGRVSIEGTLPRDGTIAMTIAAERLPVVDFERVARLPINVEGVARFDMSIAGSRASPEIFLRATVDSAGVSDVRLERLIADARYSRRVLSADIGLYYRGERAVTLAAQLPMDLRLERVANRISDEPITGRISANDVSLGIIEAFMPQVRETAGRLTSRIDVGGTWKEPRLYGVASISDGSAFLHGIGVQLERINADVQFTGDSVLFRRFSTAYDGGEAGDTASLSGAIVFRDYLNPDIDLHFNARNFRVIQLTRVADLFINSTLRLTGRYRGSALSGYVNVDRGALFIPDLAQKRLIEISDLDSTLLASREFSPPMPSELLRNLELRNVRVVIGDQVWLRSPDASTNIQLGGEISMTSVRVARSSIPGGRPSVVRTKSDSVYRLALEGTLSADRGDYRLDAGVVRRKFQVESGGTVTFFGEPELNPTLDISALHSVRRVSGPDAGRDIRIRVRLMGSLSAYQLKFESVDGIDLSESDLLSYLVTGAPSFELGAAGNEHLRTAMAILLPSLGTWFGDRFAGSRFDFFQLELGPLGNEDRLSDSFRDVLKRTRLGIGKQIGNRTFVSANTNLCQLGGFLEGKSATTEELIQSIGVKLERRLNYDFSLALSAEPSTAALRCTAVGTSPRGFVSSPPQFGLDIFKVWRF